MDYTFYILIFLSVAIGFTILHTDILIDKTEPQIETLPDGTLLVPHGTTDAEITAYIEKQEIYEAPKPTNNAMDKYRGCNFQHPWDNRELLDDKFETVKAVESTYPNIWNNNHMVYEDGTIIGGPGSYSTLYTESERHVWYNIETNELFSMRFGREVESVVADMYVYIGEL